MVVNAAKRKPAHISRMLNNFRTYKFITSECFLQMLFTTADQGPRLACVSYGQKELPLMTRSEVFLCIVHTFVYYDVIIFLHMLFRNVYKG